MHYGYHGTSWSWHNEPPQKKIAVSTPTTGRLLLWRMLLLPGLLLLLRSRLLYPISWQLLVCKPRAFYTSAGFLARGPWALCRSQKWSVRTIGAITSRPSPYDQKLTSTAELLANPSVENP